MNNYILLLPIIVAFLVTLFLLPSWIKRAHNANLVGKDMNKPNEVKVAEAGGVTVIAGFVIGALCYIAIKTFYLRQGDNVTEMLALLSVILLVSFIGIIDDLLGWKIGLSRRIRIFLVLFAAIPLIVIDAGSSRISFPFFAGIDLGYIYPLIIIPLGVVGASTTFNFLAGYNGLEARQGILLLGALGIATAATGNTWLTVTILCIIASILTHSEFHQ